MAYVDNRNRAPSVEVLPDLRLRVTRVYDVLNNVPKSPTLWGTQAELAWGTPDVQWPQCLLVKQTSEGQEEGADQTKQPVRFTRVYEQIALSGETEVGDDDTTVDQDGLTEVVQRFLGFSVSVAGSSSIYRTVGSYSITAPNGVTCVLKEEIRTDDGTLQRIERRFISSGQISVDTQTKYDGALTIQTVVYVNQIPSTPSGYTLIATKTDHVGGLPVYTYTFAKGTGQISTQTEYRLSPDQGTTGVTVTTIKYISTPAVNSNPITGPGGSAELINVQFEEQDGFRIWTAIYASGQGSIATTVDIRENGCLRMTTIVAINAAPSTPSSVIGGTVTLVKSDVRNGTRFEDGTKIYEYTWAEANGQILNETTIISAGALVTYRRTSLGTAPTAPTATIGGTVTLFETNVEGEEGYQKYDYRWSEANGQSSITKRAEADGAILYEVVTNTATATTPSYPGSGSGYLIDLENTLRDGYYVNRATYKKAPPTITLYRRVKFRYPGYINILTPAGLQYVPPVDLDILATEVISYATSPDMTAPFTVKAYASVNINYVPTPALPAVSSQEGSGGYLSGATSNSGTSSTFNGIQCDSWAYSIASSTPSSPPTGSTLIDNENDIYLTDLSGNIVYRNRKTSYSF